MTKLSTSAIKELINQYLSDPSIREMVKWTYSEMIDGDDSVTDESFQEETGSPVGSSKDQSIDFLCDRFINGKYWKRFNKFKGDQTYITTNDDGNTERVYSISEEGASFREALEEIPVQALNKCITRTFTPSNDMLADRFNLLFTTNPDDTKVIGWTIVQN